MIVFDSTLDTFRFAHLSVREFLEKLPEYTGTATNALAAGRCLLELLTASNNPATKKFLSNHGQPLSGLAQSYDLNDYSTLYWARHCQLAADQRTYGVLKEFFLFFLSNESDPRSAVAIWNGQVQKRLDYHIDRKLRETLEDCKAVKGITLFIACCFNFLEIIKCRAVSPKGIVNSNGLTALEVAVKHGSCEIISVLINDKLTPISEEVVKAAAENNESGKEVMTVLLEHRGADVGVTEEVVKAAAGNRESGKDIIKLLLKHRGEDVVVTEEVVKAAARSWGGKEVMKLLLEYRGEDVIVTEAVVKAAAANCASGKDVIKLLLEHRGADVVITEEVVNTIAGRFRNEVIIALLKKRGADVVVTEEVVKTIAGRFGKKVMVALLKKRGADVVVTEEVVKAAAGNLKSGKEVIMLLLKHRGEDVVVTEEVVKAAAGNWESGKEVIKLLLKHRGEDVVVTEEVMKVAAGNKDSGKEVIRVLLKYRGKDIVVTEEVVKAAAGNKESGKKIIILLLKHRGADVVVTEEVVKAAAGNKESGKKIIMLLLDRFRDDVQITDKVIEAAATSGQEEVLNVIEEHLKILPAKEKWLSIARFYNAAKDGEEGIVQNLLAQGVEPDLQNPRKESPLWIASANGHLTVVRLLLDTQAVEVNARSISGRSPMFVSAACGHKDVVSLLLGANADPSFVDEDGQTSFSIAKQNGWSQTVDILTGR